MCSRGTGRRLDRSLRNRRRACCRPLRCCLEAAFDSPHRQSTAPRLPSTRHRVPRRCRRRSLRRDSPGRRPTRGRVPRLLGTRLHSHSPPIPPLRQRQALQVRFPQSSSSRPHHILLRSCRIMHACREELSTLMWRRCGGSVRRLPGWRPASGPRCGSRLTEGINALCLGAMLIRSGFTWGLSAHTGTTSGASPEAVCFTRNP